VSNPLDVGFFVASAFLLGLVSVIFPVGFRALTWSWDLTRSPVRIRFAAYSLALVFANPLSLKFAQLDAKNQSADGFAYQL